MYRFKFKPLWDPIKVDVPARVGEDALEGDDVGENTGGLDQHGRLLEVPAVSGAMQRFESIQHRMCLAREGGLSIRCRLVVFAFDAPPCGPSTRKVA